MALSNVLSATPNSQKFGRYFVLKAETAGGLIVTIQYPFTCEFSVTRNNLASVNSASFVIYNLNETTRLSLFKDAYDVTTFRLIEFYAGYVNETTNILPLVFKGSIKQCYSERTGPDFKTVIECFDGQQAMTSGFVSQTAPAGATIADQVKGLIAQMPNITGGTIGNGLTGESKRGTVQFGNPAEIIKQLTNADFYIDRLVTYVIDTSDVLTGELIVLNAKSGILDVPKKTETSVTMSILFEPRILVSQLVSVDSSVGVIYNGEYKVTGITHKGVISGAVGGDCRTTLSLLSLGGAVPVYRVVPDNNTFKGERIVIGN